MAGATYKFFSFIIILIALASGVFWFSEKYVKHTQGLNIQIQTNGGKETEKPEVLPANNGQKSVTLLFLGDLMFDRYIREVAQKKGNEYIFEKVSGLLKNTDLVVANLEGPITDNSSVSAGTMPGEKNHLVFTFDKSLAKTLSESNIGLVNVGNNHSLNFGQSGFDQTKTNLSSENVDYFGELMRGGEDINYIAHVNGYKIGFVNYNQFVCQAAPKCVSIAVENIGSLKKQADLVVVYTHWGAEYKTDVSQNTKNLGHQFIDSGADLVIGSHPHVVQEKEEYRGHWIYYSLGNFIFDQYFSPETKKGLAVKVIIDANKKIKFEDISLILDNNGQTRVNAL